MISQKPARRKQKERVKRCARIGRENNLRWRAGEVVFLELKLGIINQCVVRKERRDSAKEIFSLVQNVVVEELTQRNTKVEFSAEVQTPDRVSRFPQISLSGQRSIPQYSSKVHRRE